MLFRSDPGMALTVLSPPVGNGDVVQVIAESRRLTWIYIPAEWISTERRKSVAPLPRVLLRLRGGMGSARSGPTWQRSKNTSARTLVCMHVDVIAEVTLM